MHTPESKTHYEAGISDGHAYAYVPGTGATGLLLLHGTGGNEFDLLPLGRRVAPGMTLLSPRGAVLEHGMPRFFRRLAEGVFDQEDLTRRTRTLKGFLDAFPEGLDGVPGRWIALGFSNGANMASSLAFRHPGLFAGAILLRPMVPFEPEPLPDFDGLPVLLLFGAGDPIVSGRERERLIEIYRRGGAEVEAQVLPASHGLTQADGDLVTTWMEAIR